MSQVETGNHPSGRSDAATVIMVARGTSGDIVPMIEIARSLARRGSRIVFVTHCSYRDRVEALGVAFIPLDTPEEYQSFISDGPLLNEPRGVAEFFRRHYAHKVDQDYRLLRRLCHKGRQLIVSRYMSTLSDQLMAERFEIPYVCVFPFPAIATMASVQMLKALFDTELRPDIETLRRGLRVDSESCWPQNFTPAAFLGLWPDWFTGTDVKWGFPIHLSGFAGVEWSSMNAEIPHEIRGLTNCEMRPIVVTTGSGAFYPPSFFHTTASACRLIGRSAIIAGATNSLTTDNIAPGAKCVGYVPYFGTLVRAAAAVIHHGGIGTIAHCLAAGVPQLVLAYGTDRPFNAGLIARLGVGEFLPRSRWEPREIAAALARLTDSQTIRERCRHFAGLLASGDGAVTAADLIERLMAGVVK